MNKPSKPFYIKTCARSSSLSKAQEQEVLFEIQKFYPEIHFETTFLKTTGDQDLNTSLRTLEKTDFFTKELDQLLLNETCRIAIHSAKDLPDPLPTGLKIIAITQGLDSSDSLVLREGESLFSGAKIATSSERREENVKSLQSNLNFKDIRGTIEERLKKLTSGEVDGVVIAECALIRLKLNPNRIPIPGHTTPGQGKLAVVARANDIEMEKTFSKIDTRTKSLYLGLEPPKEDPLKKSIHHPIIKIVPRDTQIPNLSPFTHLIFTSKTAVDIFFSHTKPDKHTLIAVGQATANRIRSYNFTPHIIAQEETAEGVVEELKSIKNGTFLWPHAALARPVISNYFIEHKIGFEEWILYDTYPNITHPLPNLQIIDEVIFTSPSTVEAFFSHFKIIPPNIKLIPIGPITADFLWKKNAISNRVNL